QHCAYGDCTSDLENARGGVFCVTHEQEYGPRCHIVGCTRQKVARTQACERHQEQWNR
ncbi:hypothetical protein AMATHDRAFT_95132, partial [Amanita thiersii Skay4041]